MNSKMSKFYLNLKLCSILVETIYEKASLHEDLHVFLFITWTVTRQILITKTTHAQELLLYAWWVTTVHA